MGNPLGTKSNHHGTRGGNEVEGMNQSKKMDDDDNIMMMDSIE
jgi:hypothetical protein